MKRILPLLTIILLTNNGFGEAQKNIPFISRDSIRGVTDYINSDWKFKDGDDSAMAQPGYDESKWKDYSTSFYYNDKKLPDFKGIGWFRFHFIADSSICGIPLAMIVAHLGASEIYLDGKLIKSFGKINGADSSVYYDPQQLPFIFSIPNPGSHVLAVRYANYNAKRNYKVYREAFAGFRLMIGETDDQIYHKDLRSIALTFIMMLLSGFFFAFCLIHLFMYLHYRSVRSNLYFSIFMLSLAVGFVIAFICYASHTPSLEMNAFLFINPVFVVGSLALSGFINELFNKKKLRFKLIVAFGILITILRFCSLPFFGELTLALIIMVSIEAVFTVIYAIIKRVKGARIIGTGILFFTLFILTIFAIAMIQQHDLDVNDSTIGGRILIAMLGLAIISIPVSMSVYLAWNFSSINKNLALQLDQVQVLSQKTLEQELDKQRMLENRKEELEKEVLERTSELRIEKKKSDDLLLNILPSEVAEELKNKGSSEARDFELVTVMFTDFKDFTKISEQMSPAKLVEEIDYCFSAFDNIIQKHGVEKIKTIGDAFMCAGGLPMKNSTHAEDTVKAALEILEFMVNQNKEKLAKGETPFEIRIGINTGPVVAGIVGVKKFAYDIWGDTVNLANRMESSGEAGKINISGSTFELVKDKFTCIHRGKIQTKNKGEVDMYFVSKQEPLFNS